MGGLLPLGDVHVGTTAARGALDACPSPPAPGAPGTPPRIHGAHEVLDRCDGHPAPQGVYHYVATVEFPYTLGCYCGTPPASRQSG